ncbi:MAG: DNA polymerase III subunit beta [Deferribacteraceae bacterium]|jgi:DNA polymerase-3 subunit beta|nr:DNA polymerase III subunit beta [Deferribacteraceae bacterium]
MKFTVLKEKLYPFLQYAGNFTTTKNLSTILQNVLIEAADNKITIKSTNFQTGFSCTIDANVTEPGATTAPAKKLTDIVKELPDGKEIDFTFDGSRLHVKAGRSAFQLSTMDQELFPRSAVINPEYSFTIDSDTYISLLKRIVFCIANDTSKPEYNGAHMSLFADRIEFSSADYQRIATAEAALEGTFTDEFIANIPKKTALDIIKIFDGAGPITIETDKRQIIFKTASLSMTSKLIEKYIRNLTRLFLIEYNLRATINRTLLMEVVRRISAITSEITHGVQLSFASNQLTVTSLETELGKGNEVIEGVQFESEPIDIIFNARHLLEILGNTNAENIEFAMNTKTQPALILPDNQEAKYLLVPISIEKLS